MQSELLTKSVDRTAACGLTPPMGIAIDVGNLYERHRQLVYSLCLRMTGNWGEAEDLTQEIFIQLLRKACSFRGESQFTTWLYRLTINHVLMHFRRANRRKRLVSNDFQLTPPKLRQNSVVVERIALNAALDRLSPGCRAVFLMFDVEGYNHEEIASMFGCSVGNSKSQLHKARKKLRRLLN